MGGVPVATGRYHRRVSRAPLRFASLAVHAGQDPDPSTGAVIPAIHLSSTFRQSAPGQPGAFEYSRSGNPNRQALETQVAALEGAQWGLAYASGLAALDSLGRLLRPGDRVILNADCYGGTYRYFARVLGDFDVNVEVRDLSNPSQWRFRNTSVVWIESPTNPWLQVLDIAAISRRAHDAGAILAVDNTFASPYLTRPLELGADVVMHSATKYLGGHSDLVAGVLAGNNPELRERLAFNQNAVGSVPGAFECWLASRGIKTLALRMERHCATAQALAERLKAHPGVRTVLYPGLNSHPSHAVAERQMRTPDGRTLYGGMLSLRFFDANSAVRFVQALELFTLAESLGGVESLAEIPALMTHGSVAGTDMEVPADLVRLSVGLEDPDDLWADLEQALGVMTQAVRQAIRPGWPTPTAPVAAPDERTPSPAVVTQAQGNPDEPPALSVEARAATPEPAVAETAPVETVEVALSEPAAAPSEPAPRGRRSRRGRGAATPAANPEPTPAAPEPAAITAEPAPVDAPEPTPATPKDFQPARGDPTTDLDVPQLERYARLRDWRNTEAATQDVSRFIVASNALLAALAVANPGNETDLHGIKGIGPERTRKYAAPILQALKG